MERGGAKGRLNYLLTRYRAEGNCREMRTFAAEEEDECEKRRRGRDGEGKQRVDKAEDEVEAR